MEIDQFVKTFASQFEDADIENITANTEFKNLETWDSLTAFSIQSMIEDEFNVSITPDELKSCITVRDVLDLIKSK